MNPDFIDGNVADPLIDDSCRWHGNDGDCNDPDHDCPLKWPECCWGCRIYTDCKQRCHSARG